MADPTDPNNPQKPGSGYGKRPLWQWIILYAIIAGILYFGIYYFFIHKNSSSPGNGNAKTLQQPLY